MNEDGKHVLIALLLVAGSLGIVLGCLAWSLSMADERHTAWSGCGIPLLVAIIALALLITGAGALIDVWNLT